MGIRFLALIAILALLPWHALAGDPIAADNAGSPGACLANLGRAVECLEHEVEATMYAVAVEAPELTAATDWKYPVGIGLFIAGNAIAFSFPVWTMLGAEVTTVTGVIIAGEVIEVAGIFIMGEEALNRLKESLRDWTT
jgi:hypothetical protein